METCLYVVSSCIFCLLILRRLLLTVLSKDLRRVNLVTENFCHIFQRFAFTKTFQVKAPKSHVWQCTHLSFQGRKRRHNRK